MRLGLLGDIHGNTTALDNVLAAIAGRSVDMIVCLGDLAANGPDPIGAVERIADLECVVVAGNTDHDMIDPPGWWDDPGVAGAPASAVRAIEISRWCASQLGDDHRAFLEGLPATVAVDLGQAGGLLAFHGSPASATDSITADTPIHDMAGWLGEAREKLLVGGHTHVPMMRRLGTQTIVNPGSVGLPFVEYGFVGEVGVAGHAAFGIVTIDEFGSRIELCEVAVASDELAREVHSSLMPHGDWWLGLRSMD